MMFKCSIFILLTYRIHWGSVSASSMCRDTYRRDCVPPSSRAHPSSWRDLRSRLQDRRDGGL